MSRKEEFDITVYLTEFFMGNGSISYSHNIPLIVLTKWNH